MRSSKARFGRYLQRWWESQVSRPLDGGGSRDETGWREGRSADDLASELRRDAQFEISQAAFLHRRPDRETAAQLVAMLVPEPSPEDSEVIVEAIVRAGSTAQKVRATTVIGAVLTVIALALRNVLRGR